MKKLWALVLLLPLLFAAVYYGVNSYGRHQANQALIQAPWVKAFSSSSEDHTVNQDKNMRITFQKDNTFLLSEQAQGKTVERRGTYEAKEYSNSALLLALNFDDTSTGTAVIGKKKSEGENKEITLTLEYNNSVISFSKEQ